MEKAIKRAIEGGWKPVVDIENADNFGVIENCGIWAYERNGTGAFLVHSQMLLDPLFWQALGKAEGWKKSKYLIATNVTRGGEVPLYGTTPDWKDYWRAFIDHLIEGKPIDEFFDKLLA